MTAPNAATDDPRAALVALLMPVLDTAAPAIASAPTGPLATIEGATELAALLNARWPTSSPAIEAVAVALRTGVAQGWLCERGEPDARFSRLAKPSADTLGCSLDVVSLRGAALEHGHPAGEITLAVGATATDEDARFDGHRAGWIVLPAGSRHIPTVTGGRMILLYALPRGAIDWARPTGPDRA